MLVIAQVRLVAWHIIPGPFAVRAQPFGARHLGQLFARKLQGFAQLASRKRGLLVPSAHHLMLIYLLVPQVKLPKRLDLALDAVRAHDALLALVTAKWVAAQQMS